MNFPLAKMNIFLHATCLKLDPRNSILDPRNSILDSRKLRGSRVEFLVETVNLPVSGTVAIREATVIK